MNPIKHVIKKNYECLDGNIFDAGNDRLRVFKGRQDNGVDISVGLYDLSWEQLDQLKGMIQEAEQRWRFEVIDPNLYKNKAIEIPDMIKEPVRAENTPKGIHEAYRLITEYYNDRVRNTVEEIEKGVESSKED